MLPLLTVAIFVAAAPTEARGRDPFEHLFAPDGESLVAPEPKSLDAPTVDAIHRAIQAETHPEPAHTGFKALLFETASDFNSYPRRQSTWVILGIGGAAAALAHPADDEVNDQLAGSDAASKFFAPGKYFGSFYTQTGVAVGLYVVGR